MSRRISGGDLAGASAVQNRSIGLTFLLSAPFVTLFLAAPLPIVSAAFLRGAFDPEAASRAASVLQQPAYAFGLAPMVLIRSNVAGFQARGDTLTPMLCFFAGLAINLVLKFSLYRTFGATGLGHRHLGGRVGEFPFAGRCTARRETFFISMEV